ncbi:ATP-dependent helicase HrpB [Pseudooceanicola nitratireducens]|uniref:ATP-dependent helicase HrpB n=1 Tax=Pseudooceanicola nitratireducens TaxID=517719 RepID=A0A1I1K9R4_9RHOB|nr:ATP-dependent helicase HrpB [Pseudooceanicola nitratireducens]SEJ47464.1 ATP-dependent helicase HrpB [Pseudooceanicola nitratireducens]SFC57624.1 ATP-dependent helicase HrpB [Pseudooceanicola nitratireducens]
MTRDALPIDDILPDLITALRAKGRAVLQAPPGAGKTTRVPLAMLDASLTAQKIVMLEPRRLAARAAADRMAATLGEETGQTVGYRVRGDAQTSKSTRIEVVTEGILTRMIQSDPELSGIGAVIFDEFHERSLNADLGLALCLEIAGALRDDLILLAMSATLDAAPVAELMQAPILTSEGRAFPVDIRHLDRPLPRETRIDQAAAEAVLRALPETSGGLLVFLPGEGEIRRTEARLRDRLPAEVALHTLFGAMPLAAQRAAIRPAQKGRKIVLATSIAETSLTIEDIRVVIDAGLARRARFDPGSGMSRLVTERASRAEATQRAGRAGRVADGTCYRLWTRGEEGALPPFAPPEIETADLAPLALDLAQWGAAPDAVPLLTPPNAGTYAEGLALLTDLGALKSGQITDHGRALAALPTHPRLANMLVRAGKPAATLAALLAERDPLPRGAPTDLSLRIEAIADPKVFAARRPWAPDRGGIARIREDARRLSRLAPDLKTQAPMPLAEMAALAYPDRIGQRRKGDTPRYVLSGGKGAVLPEGDTLAAAPFLVATDLDGNPREAKIRQAVQITAAEIRAAFPDRIQWVDSCSWSKQDRRVQARQQERLGHAVLDDRIWKDAPKEAIARAMLDGVRDLGLTISDKARLFLARARLAADSMNLPDHSDQGLLDTAEDWLLPYLSGIRDAASWRRFDILPALKARLDWDQAQALDRIAPPGFTTPLGRTIAIDYASDPPEVSLRLQELFGQTSHPSVGGTPLKLTLLSPAGRPIQTTSDLPGFWSGSYADVRKDMRARYPKHPWPEDPTQADPTLRAKPRKA